LNICGHCAAEHEFAFNCNKVIGVFFVPKTTNNLLHQLFFSDLCTCTTIIRWSQIS